MVQTEQTKALLKALATNLVQVQKLSNVLMQSAFDDDDWQFQKLADIAEQTDDNINEVALMMGHADICELSA